MSSKQKNNKNFKSVQFLEVGAAHAGQRVDNFLLTTLKGIPKSLVYRIIRKGEVRVNKGRVKQTTRLTAGDIVRIPPLNMVDKRPVKVDVDHFSYLKGCVLFEDDVLLVIDKPSGLAVHAGSGIRVGLIEAMRAVREDLSYLELAHRLDRETSGCLVLAKKASALKVISQDFRTHSQKNHRLDKCYLSLLKGNWRFGERAVVKPLDVQARRAGERHVCVSNDGSYAKSLFRPRETFADASLMEVKLMTGRTHQVRVHAQSEGHPVAGDARYGDANFNRAMKDYGLNRLFLHASKLTFFHPTSQQRISVEATLPSELKMVLDNLQL